MATVSFGNVLIPYPEGYTNNGNWADVTQWYANAGGSGEGYYFPSVPLYRFPDPAVDIVQLNQSILRGGGTWVGGTYPTGSYSTGTYAGQILTYGTHAFDDPNCTWSGKILYYPVFKRGTFTGDLSEIDGRYGGGFFGGTFTNTVIFSTSSDRGFRFGESTSIGGPAVNTLTLPSGFNIKNPSTVVISRSMTIDFPIVWSTLTRNRDRVLSVQTGDITDQFPVFTQDMSTAVTGCISYNIFGSPRFANSQKILLDLSTVFVNTATLTIGTPSVPGAFEFYDIKITQPTTAYIGKGFVSSTTYFNQYSVISGNVYNQGIGLGDNRIDKLTLITPSGFLRSDLIVGGTYTYAVTVNIPILRSQEATKYAIDHKGLPLPYSFGQPGSVSKFEQTVLLNLPSNLSAASE
jgi:hypothetical protein